MHCTSNYVLYYLYYIGSACLSCVQHICKKEYITFLNFFHPVFCYFLYTTGFEWAHQLWSHRWASPTKMFIWLLAAALVLDVWFSKYFSLSRRALDSFLLPTFSSAYLYWYSSSHIRPCWTL